MGTIESYTFIINRMERSNDWWPPLDIVVTIRRLSRLVRSAMRRSIRILAPRKDRMDPINSPKHLRIRGPPE